MTCCDYGKCTNAPNCPVRQAHREAANKAYAQLGMVVDTDPYEDTLSTVKFLIVFMGVIAALTLFTFWYWGK